MDFFVTGCSSGVGMSIACNPLLNVISEYLPIPTDAYLFGRAGELNLRFTLEKLFEEPFNTGYPAESAK
ncbi:hypothetical protein P9Z75_24010 [Bacillus tropicus]|nr:hypothetical protein [Bacillus tropicus]MEC2926682.1 hypothetical protein [Bacillus tropicus]MEC2956089.1 hypothetical protein [Bacillus tropicus]MEC3051291.1 hypothetical protein [Bacillus tropicus]MEC3077421.1 hypothetical protein [Bacillus tropicus]